MEEVCDGFDNSDYFGSSASGRNPNLAAQQKLGLWTKRRHRPYLDNRPDPVFAKGHLDENLIQRSSVVTETSNHCRQ
jgi:hypothetical protein